MMILGSGLFRVEQARGQSSKSEGRNPKEIRRPKPVERLAPIRCTH